jgi:hypothetical protein
VPANDTHGCVTGEEPACHAGDGGHGYSWSESELSDGFAQSNDGWYYVPVDSLMRLFATYSGCGAGNTVFGALFDTRNDLFTKTGSGQTQENLRTAFCAGKDAWTDPEVTGLGWARRETQWDGDSNLYCVSTEDSECRGPGAGVRLMRCSWEGGHSWPSACHRGCTEIPWVRSKAVPSPPFLTLGAQKSDLILSHSNDPSASSSFFFFLGGGGGAGNAAVMGVPGGPRASRHQLVILDII